VTGIAWRWSARTWLLAISRRTCADAIRRRRVRRLLTERLAATAMLPEPSSVADPADRVLLDELIRRLEPDRRSAFVLTQALGLSYAEAAEVCGCPVGTIRSRIARARGDLIDWLRHDDRVTEEKDQRFSGRAGGRSGTRGEAPSPL
jgi:RNA polymerase sigma-70 factor (ECF subfamily)